MNRRNFISAIPIVATGSMVPLAGRISAFSSGEALSVNHREYWLSVLEKIALPVLKNLASNTLKSSMPVETNGQDDRSIFAHLEAFGRLMAGIAPWLNLPVDSSKEGSLRKDFLALYYQAVANAVNPDAPDYMNFSKGTQPLVDTAFLAHALLRVPEKLWEPLNGKVKENIIQALQQSRQITPYYSNWLLFSAMVETALHKFTGKCDRMRVDLAMKKHMEWYLGDGVYGDGPEYHADYYNSFVIQPMLVDISEYFNHQKPWDFPHDKIIARAQRYAAIQERMIAADGTFPPLGRSLVYRFGVFQLLSQVALKKLLPAEISPSQVRCALTKVIQRMSEAEGTFSKDGWLQLGFCGHQPEVAESYICTGSLYLCATVFLALGLSHEDEFWTAADNEWTSLKAWTGKGFQIDKALKNN